MAVCWKQQEEVVKVKQKHIEVEERGSGGGDCFSSVGRAKGKSPHHEDRRDWEKWGTGGWWWGRSWNKEEGRMLGLLVGHTRGWETRLDTVGGRDLDSQNGFSSLEALSPLQSHAGTHAHAHTQGRGINMRSASSLRSAKVFPKGWVCVSYLK